MFRSMRRSKQLLSPQQAEAILRDGRVGVLGVHGDDGYPYTVPVNYAFEEGKIYFHSAKTGHKLDGILRSPKVSFCVIARDDVIPEKFTSHFRSAVAFGHARIVTEDGLKQHAMELLVHKYSPGRETEGAAEIRADWDRLLVVEITLDHLTGKQALELVSLSTP